MRLAINAAAMKLGGVLTYFSNLLPALSRGAYGAHTFLLYVPPEHVERLRALAPAADIRPCPAGHGSLGRRLAWDHVALRRALLREKADVLLSLNFPMAAPPCPQLVWIRNARYFSKALFVELRREKRWRECAEVVARRWLTRATLRWADMLLFPTAAFRDEVLQRWSRLPPLGVLPYAPDASAAADACPPNVLEQLRQGAAPGKTLCFPSLPGAHKNLKTALGALELVARDEHDVRLLLTSYPRYEPFLPPALRSRVTCFSPFPKACMPALYCHADVVLFPSICESFGLPLVEAMAHGKPIVASDIATSREICGDAARYVPTFDAQALARETLALLRDSAARTALGAKALARVKAFSWETHASALIKCCEKVLGS